MIDLEALEETLVLFMVEHTGLSRHEVVRFLDAQDRFWESRWGLFEEFEDFVRNQEDD